MDAPWSAFVCGSQGAGKSHTITCLLENAILPDPEIADPSCPLTAMVFHYDTYTGASITQICETAYICSSGAPVTVLVSPSNIWAMTKLYNNLPGLSGPHRPKVLPLYLSEDRLDVSVMLKLMSVDPTVGSVPLYMGMVMTILREMAMAGLGCGGFSYRDFKARLDSVQWVPGQRAPLDMRLQLLEAFLRPSASSKTTRPAAAVEDIWSFSPGSLTIVDLSDPFVNSDDACSLFSICLSLFLEDRARCGRVVVLDEAHKFLTRSGSAQKLTSDLTSIIRQQRHTGTRVLIATQEPTLSPELIDLCNMTFVHRFLSPAWYEVLKKHLAGAKKYDNSAGVATLFDLIIALRTGEALLFCPTALVDLGSPHKGHLSVKALESGHIRIKIRGRLTTDGGKSVLASETRLYNTEDVDNAIPMHVVSDTVSDMRSKGSSSQLKSRGASSSQSPTIHTPGTIRASQIVSPSSSSQATNQSLVHETRVQIRKKFDQLRWHDFNGIGWDRLYKDIEVALRMQGGTLTRNAVYTREVRQAAEDEHRKCRLKRFGR